MRTDREHELEQKIEELTDEVKGLREELARRPGAPARREYKSDKTWLGLPLVHINSGRDPETGRPGVAKGVIAIGDVAFGIVAIGGAAFGGIAFGGFALGLLGFGGMAIGIAAALGGMALGGIAFGGLAVGGVAFGGAAIGYAAIGGGAIGVYATGGGYESLRPFEDVLRDPYLPDFVKHIIWWAWQLR